MFKEEYYVSKRKKISLKEFKSLYNRNKEYLDLQQLDLSGLDLSSYVIGDGVDYFYLNNVNLENTNVTILLDTKGFSGINDSNLKGVKFITKEDDINCNFNNVKFDDNGVMQLNKIVEKTMHNINRTYRDNAFDLDTILNNQGLNLSIDSIMNALNNSKIKYELLGVLNQEKISELESIINKVLNMNETLRKFYEKIEDQLDYSDKVRLFFSGALAKVIIKDITIDDEMWHLIAGFTFFKCEFQNVILTCNPKLYHLANKDYYTEVNNVTMLNLHYSDYDKFSIHRILTTPITFKRNLYLELGRSCNAACFFCRNKCMGESEYNLENIIKSLGTIIDRMDSIVIGGGEPTSKRKDLFELLKKYIYAINKFYIFSNGIDTINFHNRLLQQDSSYKDISYYISRHSIDDEINAHILGVNPNSVPSILKLLDMRCKNIILSCTCVNGGVDTPEKIIDYIMEYNYNNVMFCNLMDDASVNMDLTYNNDMRVDDAIFDEVISFLQKQGFNYNHEVISTAGYKLYILKGKYNNDRNIIFKKYISKKELDEKWPTAIKRTFDLSIAPNGSIYENWSQLEPKTKKKER